MLSNSNLRGVGVPWELRKLFGSDIAFVEHKAGRGAHQSQPSELH